MKEVAQAALYVLAAIGLGVVLVQVRLWLLRRQGDKRWG
jgi:hypothetical protein